MKTELQRLDPLPEEQIDDKRYELLAPPTTNLVMYTDYEVDDVVKKEYDSVPPVALHVIETLIITGMAKTMRRMQLAVFTETGEMLSKEIVRYHLSLNKPQLERQRDEFAERQRRAMWTQLLELAAEPNGVRYQRLVTDLAICAEREIAAAVDSPISVGFKTLNGMVDGLKKLMDADPLYSKHMRKEVRKAKRFKEKETNMNRVDDTLARLASFEREADDAIDFGELEAYTEEIVERSGGANVYETNGESEDCGSGQEGEGDEERDGFSSESA